MREHHVEVAFAHRDIGWLGHNKPAMVQVGMHIGELHHLFEIIKGRIAATAFEIPHKGRPIDWRKYLMCTTDDHVPVTVAGNLGKLGRFLGTAHTNPLGIRFDPTAMFACGFNPGFAPDLQSGRVIAKRNPYVFQKPVDLRLKL